MKYALITGLALTIASNAATAQTNSMSNSTTPPAVSTNKADSGTTAAPVAGSNSFTETEAKYRLEKHGYTNVMDLKKDDQSVWRGVATKDGKAVGVALDYQGNITTQ